ncbi:MAG: sigma-70 family RNA polymerase sigma factor, partial [Verrucomicrobiota bacterium]
MPPQDTTIDASLDLIRRSQDGDQHAFGQLVQMHDGNVYGQILRMVRNQDDAQEITQLTWIKVWKKIGSFRFESAFSSWLYRVATFTALDAIRKRDNRKETSIEAQESFEFPSEDISEVAPPEQIRSLEHKEIKRQFMDALEKLPEKHKTALMLRETEGLTYNEIADRLNCKIGTVMSRIFNARKAIQ